MYKSLENNIRHIMSGSVNEEQKSLDEQIINETGHDDVISMKTKTIKAMKAIETMAKELDKLNDEDPLPTWWTNKVSMAVANLDNMADYLDAKVPDGNEVDEQIQEALHPDHVTLHPHKTDKTKYTVGQVGKNVKGRLNPGEHISDSEVDDLHDMGMKVKHERKPFKEAKDLPFEPDPGKKAGTVTDKSGAKHTPMSRARDLAQKAKKKAMGEEIELDENLRKAYDIMKPTKSMDHGIEAIKKHMKVDHSTATSMAKKVMDKVKSGEFKEEVEIEEKTLTPAEKKKREEIAKSIERDNPDMPMDKKMAIATATAKRVAEDTVTEGFVKSLFKSKLNRKS